MKKRIRDIAEIRTGYQFRGKVEAAEDANVAVIQIKDIDDRLNVCLDDLLPVRVDNPEPYVVSKGDVLFLSRGHRQYAAMISDAVADTIATGYFFILHPDERRDPSRVPGLVHQPARVSGCVTTVHAGQPYAARFQDRLSRPDHPAAIDGGPGPDSCTQPTGRPRTGIDGCPPAEARGVDPGCLARAPDGSTPNRGSLTWPIQ